MTFSFRPAKRSEAKPLIGLYAESGCGKTYSALLLARGFVGPNGRVGMIETEAGRGEAYADMIEGGYDVLPIRDNFSPENYGLAITAAEKAGLDALIIDSSSHEWEGAGGVLSMAAENQAGGKKGPLVWQKPKMDHQRHFMLRLLATPIPLVIVCMRAKYPMKELPNPKTGKKEWVRSDTVEPKQADDILYEMFLHGWIDHEHRLHVTKYTRPDLAQVVRDGEPITIETGKRLAEWARGSPSVDTAAPRAGGVQDETPSPSAPPAAPAGLPGTAGEYAGYAERRMKEFGSADALGDWWNSEGERTLRQQCRLTPEYLEPLKDKVVDLHGDLRAREDETQSDEAGG